MFNINLSPAWKGALKGLLGAVVATVVAFVANSANLSPAIGETAAGILAMIAVAWEHSHDVATGSSLLGVFKPKAK